MHAARNSIKYATGCAQLLEHAVRARCTLQEYVLGRLRCEVERTREHVIPLERAEEVDGLDEVRWMRCGEGRYFPIRRKCQGRGVRTLGGFVKDLVHVVLVRQPRGRGDISELSFMNLGEVAMDGSTGSRWGEHL